jgi:hypothetical protein
MSEADAAAFVGMCAAGVLALKVIVDGVTRYAAQRKVRSAPEQAAAVEARLDQLAVAVEAIAIELERQGELQRFAAQLALDPARLADSVASSGKQSLPRLVARPITPH